MFPIVFVLAVLCNASSLLGLSQTTENQIINLQEILERQ